MKTVTVFYRAIKNNRGSTSVVIVCTTLLVIIAGAVITDIGYVAFERFQLNQSAEAVAREGAKALVDGRQNAEKLITSYAVQKVSGLNDLKIKIADNNKEVTVYMGKPYEYIFLKLLGFKGKQMDARVTAKLSSVESIKGSKPFAVEKNNFQYEKLYTLSEFQPGQSGGTLSFIPVDLGRMDLKTNILYGYQKQLEVGDEVSPSSAYSSQRMKDSMKALLEECNHDIQCTYDQYEEDCQRIFILPVVDDIGTTEGKKMTIVGFTTFFVEDVYENNSQVFLKGRFIKHTVNGSTNDGVNDYGLLGVKMIH